MTASHNTLWVQLVLLGILLLALCFAYLVKEMRLRLTRSTNLASSSHGDDGEQVRQEVPECPGSDDCEDDKEEKSSSEADKQMEGDEDVTASPVTHALAASSLPPTIVKEIFRLSFSHPWC